jgi:hypothetical protein
MLVAAAFVTLGPLEVHANQPTSTEPLTRAQWKQSILADRVLGPKWSRGTGQVRRGGTLVGFGSAFTLLGVSLMVAANELGFNGPGAYAIDGVVVAIGLSMLIPGSFVLAKGVEHRKQVLRVRPRPNAWLLPTFDPVRRHAGVSFSLHF